MEDRPRLVLVIGLRSEEGPGHVVRLGWVHLLKEDSHLMRSCI